MSDYDNVDSAIGFLPQHSKTPGDTYTLSASSVSNASSCLGQSDQKHVIRQPLLHSEYSNLLMLPPICTIHFFQGELDIAKVFLHNRLLEVVALNPWLCGKLEKNGESMDLVYPSQPNSIDKIFTVLNKPITNLDMKSKYEVLVEACAPLCVGRNGYEQLQEKIVVCKFVIVPAVLSSHCNQLPGFALLISMSHSIADGYTYYEIINMLSDNPQTNIHALEPTRKHAFVREHIHCLSGPQAGNFLGSPPNVSPTSRYPSTTIRAYHVDKNKINQTKELHNHTSGSFISTNDIIFSHYMVACMPRIGVMSVDARPRCPILNANDSGNYVFAMLFDYEGYKSPSTVRASWVPHSNGSYSGIRKEMPGLKEDCELACITSWAINGSNPPFDLSSDGKVKQLLHLPIYHVEVPWARCPDNVAVVFRPLPDKLAVLFFSASKATAPHLLSNNHPFGSCVNSDLFSCC